MMRTPNVHARKPWRRRIVVGMLVVIGTLALVKVIFFSWRFQPQENIDRLNCASNLRQIRQACLLYAKEHNGRFPASFEDLIGGGRLSVQPFVCPSSGDDHAEGCTTQELLADFAKPGRCSYIYLGNGLSLSSPKNAVLVYERLDNHEREGMTVLYVGGKVAWMPGMEAASVIAALEAGHNPPRPANVKPTTQPAMP